MRCLCQDNNLKVAGSILPLSLEKNSPVKNKDMEISPEKNISRPSDSSHFEKSAPDFDRNLQEEMSSDLQNGGYISMAH